MSSRSSRASSVWGLALAVLAQSACVEVANDPAADQSPTVLVPDGEAPVQDACRSLGETCRDDRDDCCAGTYCWAFDTYGTCEPIEPEPTCLARGEACRTDQDDCCEGSWCWAFDLHGTCAPIDPAR